VFFIIDDWLINAAVEYNSASWKERENYVAHLLIPIKTLRKIVEWSFSSLPDEVLVGIDPDFSRRNPKVVDEKFEPFKNDMFAGQGFLLGEPHLINRGDSFSVHQVPEEWTDEYFSEERGARGSRFCHYIHSHPNCAAIPSRGDEEASQWTEGCEMILGIDFASKVEVIEAINYEGIRRQFNNFDYDVPVIGISSTGHRIYGMEIIAFHRSGLGINLLITDKYGNPIGLFE